jgi:hypothetical protein
MSGGQKQHSKVVWPGFSQRPPPRHIKKIGRNEPCPCGSGKKYKDCHEREGAAFLEKLEKQDEKRHRKEARRLLKQAGVPWYRRIFLQK